MRHVLSKAACAGVAGLALTAGVQAAPLNLQDVPLYLLSRADPNVLLNMSVETPMGGAAYTDNIDTPPGCAGRATVDGHNNIGTCYIPTVVYRGYFDSGKCYTYVGSTFEPASLAGPQHTCTGRWSGNFLNWATMTAIDMFIHTMTGGNRVVDTTSSTVVRRARKQNDNNWFPRKVLNGSVNVAPSTVTPFADSTIWIHNTDFGFAVGTTFDSATGATPDKGSFEVRVKVCDPGVRLENNCVAYGAGASTYYKPEGLIQANANAKRFGVMSYTFDNSKTRDGGVLRSNMKYVGPKLPDGTDNPKAEFGTDGLLIHNPDGATGGLNSGVINYINKFSDPGYKTYDPISELFYETIRYFKNIGPTPEYSSGLTTEQCGGFQVLTTWEDPIKYPCQKNFIIAINDANPWLDKKLPGTYFTSSSINGAAGYVPFNLSDNDYGQPSNPDPDINVRELTNRVGALEGLHGTWSATGSWTSGSASGANDSVGGGTGTWDESCSTSKNVSALGEVMGTCPSPGKQNSYYIAGLAYYANTTDLRPDLPNDQGIQNVRSFVIDTQEFSTNPLDGPRNMLWLAGKYGGWDDADGDGEVDKEEWDADNNGIPDNYVLATQPDNLVAGLNRAFDFINSQESSASSASVNAGSISDETRVYQAKFNSTDWTGELLSFTVNSDGSLSEPNPMDGWRAATIPAPNSRQIITANTSGTGVAFRWDSLDSTRKGELDADATIAELRLNYLRGDGANEAQNATAASTGPKFRNRPTNPRNVLGDIISSSPAFVGKPPFFYRDATYSAFVAANANRTKMLYVGANDGMLHAFDATTGAEKFAFIPKAVFRNLPELTRQTYSHRFYVDGTPTMGDAFYDDAWHTILVGGLNNGGQGVYALDITDPANLTETNAASIYRWEFTDEDDADLGFTHSRPAIAKVRSGGSTRWVAIFGNGYNNTFDDTATGGQKSSSGEAVLYIVSIRTGALIRKITTGRGAAQDPLGLSRPNGLATPAVVDINGDSVADYVFAGDLFGNLWKFNLTSADENQWDVAWQTAGVKQPLFVAKDASGKVQPITSRPEVGRGPNGRGMVVLFGTGKFLEGSDRNVATLTPQTFYGLIDPNTLADSDRITDRATQLTKQEITHEGSFGLTGKNLRVTTANTVTNRGWYLDLISPAPTGFQGEMQVSDPILRSGRVIFSTLVPNSDPCKFGGTSWLMELDALSGARLPDSPYDVNGDGEFNEEDLVNADGEEVPVSGWQSDVGITGKPGVLSDGEAEYKYLSGSSGNMAVRREKPGVGDTGRQSWRQLR